MLILIFFIIPIISLIIWFVVTKSCWKVRNESGNFESIKFPLIVYIAAAILLAIPLLNWILCIGIWVVTLNLWFDEDSEEFLAALSGEDEDDIEFSKLSNIFKKF